IPGGSTPTTGGGSAAAVDHLDEVRDLVVGHVPCQVGLADHADEPATVHDGQPLDLLVPHGVDDAVHALVRAHRGDDALRDRTDRGGGQDGTLGDAAHDDDPVGDDAGQGAVHGQDRQ